MKRYYIFGTLPRINRKLVPAYNRKTKKSYIRTSNSWKKLYISMVLQVQEQVEITISEHIDMVATISIPEAEDSDAVMKGLLDALEEGGAIEDDNLIRDIYIHRSPGKDEDYAIIDFYKENTLSDILEGYVYEEEGLSISD